MTQPGFSRDDFRFRFPFRVRYSEIDGQNVVFNAHYLTFFDTAITEYFRLLEIDFPAEVKATGHDFHVVKSLIEYRSPLVFDQRFEVAVRIARIGSSSVTFNLGAFDEASGALHTTGEIVWVYTNQTTHRPAPVPALFRDRIGAFEGL